MFGKVVKVLTVNYKRLTYPAERWTCSLIKWKRETTLIND